MKYESTGWEITGASGITGMIETPIANVGAGAGYIRLPIKNTVSGKEIMVHGPGVGLSGGFSISAPLVSVSGSLDSFPADGIGSIVKGPGKLNRDYQSTDFNGEILVVSLSAGKEVTGSISGVIWLNKPIEACMLNLSCSASALNEIARNMLTLMMGGFVPAGAGLVLATRLRDLTRAAGCYAGMGVESQLIGAGGDILAYKVAAV